MKSKKPKKILLFTDKKPFAWTFKRCFKEKTTCFSLRELEHTKIEVNKKCVILLETPNGEAVQYLSLIRVKRKMKQPVIFLRRHEMKINSGNLRYYSLLQPINLATLFKIIGTSRFLSAKQLKQEQGYLSQKQLLKKIALFLHQRKNISVNEDNLRQAKEEFQSLLLEDIDNNQDIITELKNLITNFLGNDSVIYEKLGETSTQAVFYCKIWYDKFIKSCADFEKKFWKLYYDG